MALINIGFGNTVVSSKIVAILGPSSAPIRRLIADARDMHRLIDVTQGRRTRAVLVTESDHIILSSVQPETISQRFPTPNEE